MLGLTGGRLRAPSRLQCDAPPLWCPAACCRMPPSPELLERFAQMRAAGAAGPEGLAPALMDLTIAEPSAPGLNDAVVTTQAEASPGIAGVAPTSRAPVAGTLQVLVVLVDFPGTAWSAPAGRFDDLFFSTSKISTGSVHEYYTEVSNSAVSIAGQVAGPFTLPNTLAFYANGGSGMAGSPNARNMALDAFNAAVAAGVNFGIFDNDGDGFVDAFVIVHAGLGAEATGSKQDIWSHKWTLPTAQTANSKQVYGYLTVPEDAKLGVCAHELGHLLFGWPDLYDTTGASSGLGNFCLMAGGSWGGGGDTPTHPSAWCKAQQNWVAVNNISAGMSVALDDVKTKQTVLRLWSGGASGAEYFLAENRQLTGFDQSLPGAGLLVYHVDDSQPGNTNHAHYKVGLVQADGKAELESGANRGDAADPYPGTGGNAALDSGSTPNTNDYAGNATSVAIGNISLSSGVIGLDASV